jgi:putative hemolysin
LSARSGDAVAKPFPVNPVDVLVEVRTDVREMPLKRTVWLENGPYVVRLAMTEKERAAAFRLRFLVFNLERGLGIGVQRWLRYRSL